MRTLTFTLISGYPYNMSETEMEAKIKGMVQNVSNDLWAMNGVIFEHSEIRKFGSHDGSIKKVEQMRVYCKVRKEGRGGTTWNDIMEAVNKTYAPYYKFV